MFNQNYLISTSKIVKATNKIQALLQVLINFMFYEVINIIDNYPDQEVVNSTSSSIKKEDGTNIDAPYILDDELDNQIQESNDNIQNSASKTIIEEQLPMINYDEENEDEDQSDPFI